MLIPFFEPRQIPAAALTDGNMVIHSRLRKFENQREHQGISIKYVLKGTENYELEGESFRVNPGQFLLVSHGRKLATQLKSSEWVEGVCFYFSVPLVQEVARSLQHSDEKLLEMETKAMEKGKLPPILETVYSDQTSDFGKKIRNIAFSMAKEATEDQPMDPAFYYELATDLLKHQQKVRIQLQRLDCIKSTTRKELYRRLSLAQMYLHDNFQRELDLDEVSREACLSKFHFIRLFRQAFNQTPHQYLIQLRLNHACKLLTGTSLPLADICQEVGLKDISSFGRRFKRNYGLSPAQYRKALRA